jgi:DNA-binding CsgD family transcriptional regulator
MASERTLARAREQIGDLAGSALDADSLRWETIAVLQRAIGFERWCWPTTDPGSALHLVGGLGELDNWQAIRECILLEQTEDPHNAVARLAGDDAGQTATLVGETGGDTARSPRWETGLKPWGIGDELRSALVDDLGMWGFIDLMRDTGDPPFDEHDIALLDDVGPALAGALRRRAARQDAPVTDGPPAGAGVLLLDEQLAVNSWTDEAATWLDVLAPPGAPPLIVYGVAARSLARRRGVARHPGSRVRVRARTGHWAVVEGAPVQGAHEGSIAVTIRPATPEDLLDLICASYVLTLRERQLVRALLEGRDTSALVSAMGISRHTVQDHLKSIFAKTGVQSRRELVALMRSGTAG